MLRLSLFMPCHAMADGLSLSCCIWCFVVNGEDRDIIFRDVQYSRVQYSMTIMYDAEVVLIGSDRIQKRTTSYTLYYVSQRMPFCLLCLLILSNFILCINNSNDEDFLHFVSHRFTRLQRSNCDDGEFPLQGSSTLSGCCHCFSSN